MPVTSPLQRKKSLPDVAAANEAMSREEVSVLSSARREEIRRLQEENERLRANPLLYLVSPHVKVSGTREHAVARRPGRRDGIGPGVMFTTKRPQMTHEHAP